MPKKYFIILICLILSFMGIKNIRCEEAEKIINWKTHMEFSYINISGTTNTQTLSGKLDLRKENKKHRYFAKGNIQYAKDYDNDNKTYEETVNKWSLDGRYEKTFTQKLFGFLSANYINDDFSGYKYRTTVGPGFGYDIAKTKRHYLKGLLSVLYSYDRFAELEDNEKSDSYGSGKVAVDYVWHTTKNLTFKEMADYSLSFEDNDKYFINSETAIEMKVNTFISLGLSYIIAYQNIIPSSDTDPTDTDPNEQQEIEHTDRTFLASIIIDF